MVVRAPKKHSVESSAPAEGVGEPSMVDRSSGVWRRLLARCIDWLLYPLAGLGLMSIVLNVLWMEASVFTRLAEGGTSVWWQTSVSFSFEECCTGFPFWYEMLSVGFVLFMLTEIPLTVVRGQTVGKMITRMRVVNTKDGQPPGPARACARWAVLYLPLLIPIIGILLTSLITLSPLFNPQRRGWHGKAVGTIVISGEGSVPGPG